MAGHLAAAGHAVPVHNRTTVRADDWVAEHGSEAAPTPRDVVRDADIVFMCVGNDDDVRSVMLGDDGVLAGVRRGAVVVDGEARDIHDRAALSALRQDWGQGAKLLLGAVVVG